MGQLPNAASDSAMSAPQSSNDSSWWPYIAALVLGGSGAGYGINKLNQNANLRAGNGSGGDPININTRINTAPNPIDAAMGFNTDTAKVGENMDWGKILGDVAKTVGRR